VSGSSRDGRDPRDASSDAESQPRRELAVGKRTLIEAELQPEPAVTPGKRTLIEVEERRAAAGLAGAEGTFPYQAEIQRLFGRHSLKGTKAAVGGAAADAADALDAHAFTQGDQVAFANQPDLRRAAHEAAHVVQQRRGHAPGDGIDTPGDELEQHADAVADRVVAGQSAESLLESLPQGAPATAIQRDSKDPKQPKTTTNPDYVTRFGTKITLAIMERIENKGVPHPHPRLMWKNADGAAKSLAVAIAHYIDLVPDQKLRQMMMLSYPSDLFKLVDQARRGPEGTRLEAVNLAVATAYDEPLIASIGRMGMRAVVQYDVHHKEGSKTPLRGDQIVASSPLDRLMADLLVRTDLVSYTPKKAGGADDTPGKPFATGAHDVTFKWLGAKDPKLWNWIEVTAPPHATVEDVAQTSMRWDDGNFEPAYRAYRIAASPPYFGIPFEIAKEVPQARAFAPDDMQVTLDTGPGPRVAAPEALGKSTVSDEVALAQAPARTKGNLPVGEAIGRTHSQLAFLNAQLAPWNSRSHSLARSRSSIAGSTSSVPIARRSSATRLR
jgi:hypothetical protein